MNNEIMIVFMAWPCPPQEHYDDWGDPIFEGVAMFLGSVSWERGT